MIEATEPTMEVLREFGPSGFVIFVLGGLVWKMGTAIQDRLTGLSKAVTKLGERVARLEGRTTSGESTRVT